MAMGPARMGGAIWLYKRTFQHRNSDVFSFSDDNDFVSHWSRKPENQSRLFALVNSFLFREQLHPLRPPVFFLAGTCKEKTTGQRTSAQSPRASLSPHREVSPVLFSQPDQRPSASASDLVLFGGSDEELNDDSMSLAASDAVELSGSIADPALLPSSAPSAAKAGLDAKLLRILLKAVEELGLEWSPPEEPSRSRLYEWFLPGLRQAPR